MGSKRSLKFTLSLSRLTDRLAIEEVFRTQGKEIAEKLFALNTNFLLNHLKSGWSVLDIGCGSGRWIPIVDGKGATITGVDLNHPNIANHKKNWPRHHFFVANAEREMFELLKSESFDLAILSHILEHVTDPASFMRNLSVITSRIILEVPDLSQNPLTEIRLKLGLSCHTDDDHKFEFTFDSLSDLLRESGWNVLDFRRSGGTCCVFATR